MSTAPVSGGTSAAGDADRHRVFEALYVLNKRAKQLAREADTAPALSPTAATIPLLKRDALYRVKYLALEALSADATYIEIHEIRGTEFYCFYFDGWSFHAPCEAIAGEIPITGVQVLPDFETGSRIDRSHLSIDVALRVLADGLGLDANAHLDRRHVSTLTGFEDIGWSALDPESVT